MTKPPKRPRDLSELAAHIGKLATHEIEEPERTHIDEKAVKRGHARATKLSPERKRAIAKKAAKARWKKDR